MSVRVEVVKRGVVSVQEMGTGLIGNDDTVSFRIHTGGDAFLAGVDRYVFDNGDSVPLLGLSPRIGARDGFTDVIFPDYAGGWEITSIRETVNRNRIVVVTLNRIGAFEDADRDDIGGGGDSGGHFVPDIPVDPEYQKPGRERGGRWDKGRDRERDHDYDQERGKKGWRNHFESAKAFLLGGGQGKFALA